MSNESAANDQGSSRKQRLPVVAIDGPAGAGKSTVTRLVAERLGYTRVDTGALYRAVAWLCERRGVDWDDRAAVAQVARELAAPGALEMSASGAVPRVVVFGEDVSEPLRSQEMGVGASRVSQVPEVRLALLEVQRSLGRDGGVVLEGRDIGSVVFPKAEAKFFLTASTEIRAQRRRQELAKKGSAPALERVMEEVMERDRRDTTRPIAPLVRAPDAVEVDSSHLTIDEVVEQIVRRVREIERSRNDV